MADRLELHAILESITGVEKVYFQPPENISMVYPAVVYNKSNIDTIHADNSLYAKKVTYQVTIISHDPDNTMGEFLLTALLARWVRGFNSNNLNHEIYEINF